MKPLHLTAIAALALCTSACLGLDNLFSKSPTTPTTNSSDVRSYLGTWTGPATSTYPTPQSCANMRWNITSQSGAQMSGDFQASCAGGITLSGTVVATHSETAIPWAASGTATQGSTSCQFSLTGTGTFQGTSNILVTYAGTVCSVPVTGSETIKR